MAQGVACWACGVVAGPQVYSHRRVSVVIAVRSVRVRLRRARYGLVRRAPQPVARAQREGKQCHRLRSGARVARSARRRLQHHRCGFLAPTRGSPRLFGRRLHVCARGCQGWTSLGWTLSVRRTTAVEEILWATIDLAGVAADAVAVEGPEGWSIRRGLMRWEMSCASWARMTPFARQYVAIRYNSNHNHGCREL